jgi:hypothetical protein
MPKICYVPKAFAGSSEAIIERADAIIAEYARQGYSLTLRQLYYQFVSRDLIANKQKEYKRLGSIINDARLAGRIDWNAIEDRTRNLESLAHWGSPEDIVSACANQFRFDRWDTQPMRVEVWIEKEALAGVFERICQKLDVPYLCCRGYTSQSEMWRAAQRLKAFEKNDQRTLILHFGDHDPSGIDMSRDIEDRLRIFGCPARVKRIALNMDQVEQYEPPPNPAKVTDSRADKYIRQFGDESWELDALEPSVLSALVQREVDAVLDHELWEEREQEQEEARVGLRAVAKRWDWIMARIDPDEVDDD